MELKLKSAYSMYTRGSFQAKIMAADSNHTSKKTLFDPLSMHLGLVFPERQALEYIPFRDLSLSSLAK